MTNFTQYLAESTKEYNYKIKVVGDLSEDFGKKLEGALAKYEVKSLSKGKKLQYKILRWTFQESRMKQ